MKIVIKLPKRRVHKMLFDFDLPYAPKVEKSKKRFKRKSKNKEDYLSWREYE
jgi:hypothetical protein